MKTVLKVIAILFHFCLYGQNGKLINKNVVKLPDSLQVKIESNNDFKSHQKAVNLYKIQYLSDGLLIQGYLAIPKQSGKFPVIIYNRGGNRNFGELNDYSASILLNRLASWGYVVVASNYRGSSNSEGMEEFGGQDVNDILNLIPLVENLNEADTERMGIYGHSRGGMMTYLTLAKTCKFKAAVVGAGLANAFRNIELRPEMEQHVFSELVPNYNIKKVENLWNRSAVYRVNELCKTTPILLLHGTGDWRVSPLDALDMADSLFYYKHPFRLKILEGADHGLNEFKDDAYSEIRAFLDKYVKDLEAWPSLEPHGR